MPQTIQVKEARLPNGETLVYREQGEGPQVLLLLHGNLSSSVVFEVLMEDAPEGIYRIIAPDLRGFGGSSYHHPVSEIRDFSEDIKALTHLLGLDSFLLAGWSLGGLVAQQYTIDHPGDVSRLVLISSTVMAAALPKWDAQGQVLPGQFISSREDIVLLNAPTLETIRTQNLEMMRAGFDRAVFTEKKLDEGRYLQFLQAALSQRNKVDADCAVLHFNISHLHNGLRQGTGEVDGILCPVLVIHGERDRVVPIAMGEQLAGEIGENAQLLLLGEAGHSPFTDSQETFMQAFFDFAAGKPFAQL